MPDAGAGENSRAARWLVQAAALTLLGLVPLAFTREPLALLAWIALAAPGVGVLAGAAGLPLWPWAPCVPAVWMAALALAGAGAARVLPTPAWAAAVWTGLFLAGLGLGRVAPGRGARTAAFVLLGLVVLAGLPIGLGLADAPFPPAWTARLAAGSPLTWTLEGAGVDWLRLPAFYERAHTFDLGPELVGRPRPALAGGTVLLLGCLLAWGGAQWARLRARRARDAAPELR